TKPLVISRHDSHTARQPSVQVRLNPCRVADPGWRADVGHSGRLMRPGHKGPTTRRWRALGDKTVTRTRPWGTSRRHHLSSYRECDTAQRHSRALGLVPISPDAGAGRACQELALPMCKSWRPDHRLVADLARELAQRERRQRTASL